VRKLRPELWWQKSWLLHHDNAPSQISFFTREFLPQKNMTAVATHPTFLFPQLKKNLKGNHRQCWTHSRNTTSRIHLKIRRYAGNGAYAQMSTTSRVMVASRPIVSSWLDCSTSSGNYGWPFVVVSGSWTHTAESLWTVPVLKRLKLERYKTRYWQ
jgi:hypothetical protein